MDALHFLSGRKFVISETENYIDQETITDTVSAACTNRSTGTPSACQQMHVNSIRSRHQATKPRTLGRWKFKKVWIVCQYHRLCNQNCIIPDNILELSLTIAALKIRAPSIWSFKPCFFANSPTLSVYSTERHRPPQLQCNGNIVIILADYKARQWFLIKGKTRWKYDALLIACFVCHHINFFTGKNPLATGISH